MPRSLAITYLVITLALSVFFACLAWLIRGAAPGPVDPRELLPSMFALVLLTAVVWLLMALVRNVSVAIGRVSVRYYQGAPPEWIERPALRAGS